MTCLEVNLCIRSNSCSCLVRTLVVAADTSVAPMAVHALFVEYRNVIVMVKCDDGPLLLLRLVHFLFRSDDGRMVLPTAFVVGKNLCIRLPLRILEVAHPAIDRPAPLSVAIETLLMVCPFEVGQADVFPFSFRRMAGTAGQDVQCCVIVMVTPIASSRHFRHLCMDFMAERHGAVLAGHLMHQHNTGPISRAEESRALFDPRAADEAGIKLGRRCAGVAHRALIPELWGNLVRSGVGSLTHRLLCSRSEKEE